MENSTPGVGLDPFQALLSTLMVGAVVFLLVADIILEKRIKPERAPRNLYTGHSMEHPSTVRRRPGTYNRRHYRGLKTFWRDFSHLAARRWLIREAMGTEGLTADFRERLMLAVTDVNRCRYCRTFHIQQAGLVGLTAGEIKAYLTGIVPREVPEDQRLAVSYARCWAESSANPPQEVRDRVREEYGERIFQYIEIVLRMIWMGNLLGNSFDFLLFRVSGGRWGGVNKSGRSGKPLLDGEEG